MPSSIAIDDPRWQPLWPKLSPGLGPCPFVADGPAARRVTLAHYQAGRDATYVVVSRQEGTAPLDPLTVTIRYAPFVAGTALIYDLTDETMQGKARPFECRLAGIRCRVFALLPYQLEQIALQGSAEGPRAQLDVSFLDARGMALEAALPFHWRLLGAGGQSLASDYAATDRRGHCVVDLASAAGGQLARSVVVRSLVTGGERRMS